MAILSDAGKSAVLREFYEIRWGFYPNLAMDLIVPPLSHVVGVEVAGKLFISFVMLLLVSGTAALSIALHRRLTLWPLVAFLFLYNRSFLWGFLNFLFGVGLALWGVACWVYLRERSSRLRVLMGCIWAAAIFLAHLSALGVYGLIVAGYEWQRNPIRRSGTNFGDWAVLFAQFTVPAIIFLFVSPTAAHYQEVTVQGLAFFFESKIRGLINPVSNYSMWLDGATFLVLVGGGAIALYKGWITVAPRMRWALLGLVAFALVMPYTLFGSAFADRRLPAAIAFFLVASTTPQIYGRRLINLTGAMLTGLFVVRLVLVGHQWIESNRIYAPYLKSFDSLPVGARLYYVAGYEHGKKETFPTPLDHIASYAVIRRSVFLPSLFGYPFAGGQPLAYTSTYAPLVNWVRSPASTLNQAPNWERLAADYDYLFVVRPELLAIPPPVDRVTPVSSGDNFRLYKSSRQ